MFFYHLSGSSVEASLPQICERGLARGWRAILRAGSAATLERLDAHLWSYRSESFLPHGTAAMGHAAAQPVYLTLGRENPNGAQLLLLVEGAGVEAAESYGFARTCRFFDGDDAPALEAARAEWRAVCAAGIAARYWAQEDGRWVQKAEG